MKKFLRRLFPIRRQRDLDLKMDRFRYFILSFFMSPTRDVDGPILLIPPTNLDGSFGDELMVAAFVATYYPRKVTIYSQVKIERPDLLKAWDNVDYRVRAKYHFLLKNFSEVHVLGADNMDGGYGDYRPLQKINLLSFASKHGLKVSIKGFSLNKKASEKIKSAMVQNASLIKYNLRDIDSYKRAKEFLPLESINQVADTAFLCPKVDLEDMNYATWAERQKVQNKLIAAICPNAIQARKLGLEKYLKQIEVIIKSFQQYENCAYVFFYHDMRPQCEGLSDKDIAKVLFEKMQPYSPAFYPENISSGIQLKPYLDLADFTFTGRMHFGISGLSLKKPMFGVSYQDKFTGLVKLFGANPEHNVIDYTDLDNSNNAVKLFFENLRNTRYNLMENYQTVIELAKKNFE